MTTTRPQAPTISYRYRVEVRTIDTSSTYFCNTAGECLMLRVAMEEHHAADVIVWDDQQYIPMRLY